MRITIGISGPAGTGIFTAGTILSEILSEKGYYVIGDKEYSSVIKGGNNLFVLYISDNGYYLSKKIDYYYYFNDYALTQNSINYEIITKNKIDKSNCNFQNTYTISLILQLFGIDKNIVIDYYDKKYGESKLINKNIEDIQKAYGENIEKIVDTGIHLSQPKKIYYGNEIIAVGAMKSGLDYYSAYPMTPASSIFEVITKNSDIIFFQGEDEIAVSMSMLGAKFTGKRAMCGTSGGGFALMSESISFSNQTEIGGVYILSQRAGPSTGMPTFTEQSDINYSINSSFGDTFPIVICPSDYYDGYNLIGKALNFSDIYQHPVIYLVDKSFSECYVSIEDNNLKAEKIDRGKLENKPNDDFARYEITKDGISKYTIPGTEKGEFIASSYEHNEYGTSIESAQNKINMTQKRFEKINTFIKKEFNDNFYGYELINTNATKIFISLGFNKYTINGFIDKHNDYGAVIITVLSPLDKRLFEYLNTNKDSIEKIIFVEQNFSGQLEQLITNQLFQNNKNWINKIERIRKYDGYPIFEEDLSFYK